ncbi:MAG: hypothetical protein GY765_23115 [bacterium]|nr:hypothetical protein [bacterium]
MANFFSRIIHTLFGESEEKKKKKESLLIYQKIDENKKKLLLKPSDVLVRRTLGDLYLSVNRRAEAVSQFDWIATEYEIGGYHRKAAAVYERILKIVPGRERTIIKLVDLYIALKFLPDAKRICLDRIEKSKKANDNEKIVTYYKKILEFEKDNMEIKLALGDIYLEEHLERLALRQYLGTVDLLWDKEEYAPSEELLVKILERFDDALLRQKLFMCYTKQDKVEKAIALMEEHDLELNNDPPFLRKCVSLCLKKGLKNEAEKIAKKLLDSAPEDTDLILKLMDSYLEKEEHSKVFRLFLPTVDRYLLNGAHNNAADLLRLILNRDSEHLPSLEKLCRVYEQSGQSTGLIAVYESLIHIYKQKEMKGEFENVLQKLRILSPVPVFFDDLPVHSTIDADERESAGLEPNPAKRKESMGAKSRGLFDNAREILHEESGEIEFEIDLDEFEDEVPCEGYPVKLKRSDPLADTAVELSTQKVMDEIEAFKQEIAGDMPVPKEKEKKDMVSGPGVEDEFSAWDILDIDMEINGLPGEISAPMEFPSDEIPPIEFPPMEADRLPRIIVGDESRPEPGEITDKAIVKKPYEMLADDEPQQGPEPGEITDETIVKKPYEMLEDDEPQQGPEPSEITDEAIVKKPYEMLEDGEPQQRPEPGEISSETFEKPHEIGAAGEADEGTENVEKQTPDTETKTVLVPKTKKEITHLGRTKTFKKQEKLKIPTHNSKELFEIMDRLAVQLVCQLPDSISHAKTFSLVYKYQSSRKATRKITIKKNPLTLTEIKNHSLKLLKHIKRGNGKIALLGISIST